MPKRAALDACACPAKRVHQTHLHKLDMVDLSEFHSRLFIGSQAAAKAVADSGEQGWLGVCMAGGSIAVQGFNVEEGVIEFEDSSVVPGPDAARFHEAVRKGSAAIERALASAEGPNVLVYCKLGRNRSAAAAVGWATAHGQWCAPAAVNYVQDQRTKALSNTDFVIHLTLTTSSERLKRRRCSPPLCETPPA